MIAEASLADRIESESNLTNILEQPILIIHKHCDIYIYCDTLMLRNPSAILFDQLIRLIM